MLFKHSPFRYCTTGSCSSLGPISSFGIRHSSLVLVVLVAVARSAFAWSSAGHMVIAAGAYRDLSPKLQEKVTACLKAHPEYESWAKAYSSGPSNIDFSSYIFLRS